MDIPFQRIFVLLAQIGHCKPDQGWWATEANQGLDDENHVRPSRIRTGDNLQSNPNRYAQVSLFDCNSQWPDHRGALCRGERAPRGVQARWFPVPCRSPLCDPTIASQECKEILSAYIFAIKERSHLLRPTWSYSWTRSASTRCTWTWGPSARRCLISRTLPGP